MRHDKEKIFDLRKQGKSYREIQKLVHISRDTLCNWFKNEEWSSHIKRSNMERNIEISKIRLVQLFEGRKKMWEEKYKKVEEEAEKEFEIYKNDPLFVAGLMIYAGEGDKLDKTSIRLANVDFSLHKIFIKFSEKFFKLDKRSIKFSVLLYPDLDIEVCVKKWVSELSIPEKNVYKPQVIQGKLKTRRLHFGVGTTIILSSFLKRKLLIWIEKQKSSLAT